MPWCPKCKNEYKDGFTVCADCGTELVHSLDEKVPICFGKEQDIYEMIDFLKANDFELPEIRPAKEEGLVELFAEKENADATKRAIQVYLKQVAEERAKEAGECTNADTSLFPQRRTIERKVYESAKSKAENYKSGAYTLILVGLAGIVVLVLINLGIIPISLPDATKTMLNVVLGGMLVLFVIMGILSAKTAKQLKEKSNVEEDTKEKILAYVKNNYVSDSETEEDLSEEMRYFSRAEAIRTMILEYQPEVDDALLEYLVDELYNHFFGEE